MSLPARVSTRCLAATTCAKIVLLATAHAASRARSQPAHAPTPENLAARAWYQDAKLGMFIHWGISSVLEDGEWVMNNRGIAASEYETLAPQFNPRSFDAAAWVDAARRAAPPDARISATGCSTAPTRSSTGCSRRR